MVQVRLKTKVYPFPKDYQKLSRSKVTGDFRTFRKKEDLTVDGMNDKPNERRRMKRDETQLPQIPLQRTICPYRDGYYKLRHRRNSTTPERDTQNQIQEGYRLRLCSLKSRPSNKPPLGSFISFPHAFTLSLPSFRLLTK